MDTNELSSVTNEYDDGVVCFGPVTESQLNRYNRLPRRTVLPSDLELSQSFFEPDEDKTNDGPNENTTMCVDNSIHIAQSTNNFEEEKEEIGTIELKQSISIDSNTRFSSPCFSKYIPNAKLIDTEVINRYIRMGSISSNESSLSEDQNKSTFEDETVSFTDAQEAELIQDNYVYDETSSCEHLSVSSVIEQSASINQQNVLDDSNNVCTLIHCSQKDDTDVSICSDLELGDVTEDSIVSDEYTITPGKQRLFDLRVTKQSFRGKALVASAPFMDRIEETTTPVLPKVLDSPLISNDISYRSTKSKESLNVSSITETHHGTSSKENVFEISMFDETTNSNKLSTDSRNMNINKSLNKTDQIESTLNNTEHIFDNEQSMDIVTDMAIPTDVSDHCDKEFLTAAQLNLKSTDNIVESKIFDETLYIDKLATNNRSIDSNQTLNETDHIQSALNDTEHNLDDEKSMCILSNKTIPTVDINYHNIEELSVAMEVDIKTTNTSCMDNESDETIYTNKLSTNSQNMDFNKSLNETNHIENTLNDTEHNFDDEKSMCILSNKTIPTVDINYHNIEELSVAMEVDIKATNTSCMDNGSVKTIYTNKLSTNNQSMDLNKYLNETNHIENTLNDTEQKFNDEKSTYIISNIAISTSGINDYNNEENSIATEVVIESINTSVVDKIFDDSVDTKNLSTTNQSMVVNKYLNETNYIGNTLIDTEPKFDEKSLNIVSNMAIPTSDVNDHNDEKFSVAMEVDIMSTNTSHEDKGFNETMYTNKLSTNSKSVNFNESINETEHDFMNNVQINTVPAIHFDDKLHLSKLDNSILKNTINSDTSFVENIEVNITCNTSLEDPSYRMRQYLDFEQAVNEMCNDIPPASCLDGQIIKPKTSYDDETLEHLNEQTLSSDTFTLTKINEHFSSYDRSNLSVIIENKSLETSSNNIKQNEDFVILNNDLESESIVNEIKDNKLLNKSTVGNTRATSKSLVSIENGTDVNIQIETKANECISINCTISDSGLVENMNETKHNKSSMFSDELSKMELDNFTKISKNLNNIATKQMSIPEDINGICSKQNTLDENNLKPIANQINITDIPNSAAFNLIPETEKTEKNFIDQNKLLNNDNQPLDLLDTTKSIDNSLKEFINLEQMFNFEDNKKEKQMKYRTPKTQKLLDFSIVQQTPTFNNQAKKQKLLNFSIVDQTPILKCTQQTNPNENVINSDSLINFSSVDHMWNSEVVLKDEINFEDFKNSSNDFSSNNLSSISSPNKELLADESIRTNKSYCSNSSFNQTITDSYLNQSTYSSARNNTQNHTTELNNVEPSVLINSQLVATEPLNSINQTIEQNESKQKSFCGEHCMTEAFTKGVKSDLKLLSNTSLNKNIESAVFQEDLNQELHFDSNKRAIVDFSIIDQGILEKFELKNNTDKTSVESNRSVSNLIEMSPVLPVAKSDEQSIILSENPIISITSDDRSERSIERSSDKINSSALNFEESIFLQNNNTELLTDIQMNDESILTESPEKSSMIDSFHSIELNHVHEDNKRKMEATKEHDNIEKKMKVETEILKTPMSMLYKIKNMFRSSEKQPSCVNNTKENNFKSGKLNFNKFEENNDDFTKPVTLKKSEILTKSKIPCKVTDRSLAKNDEFNNSSLSSFNDSIKQKKAIPKFSGVPVLSDVSNSSNRKCAESRIPSKFQK